MSHLSQNQRVKPSCALLVKALALGLVLIFFGCESEPPQKAAPTKVVRKKIGASANADASQKTNSVQKAKASAATKQTNSSGTAAKAGPQKAAAAKTAQAPQTQKTAPKDSSSKAASNQGKPASKPGAQPEASKTQATAGQGQLQGLVLARKPPVVVIDPFEPLFQKEQPQKQEKRPGARTQTRRPVKLTPLEKIDLGQLKLTAIIRTPAGNKALVEEASGKGYIIQKGTWIGVHAGKVEQITGDTVVVEEEVENAIGEISLTTRELKLQKPPGE
jgi:type IV pilus assembly protein PilP